jgi:hypothetical protein
MNLKKTTVIENEDPPMGYVDIACRFKKKMPKENICDQWEYYIQFGYSSYTPYMTRHI